MSAPAEQETKSFAERDAHDGRSCVLVARPLFPSPAKPLPELSPPLPLPCARLSHGAAPPKPRRMDHELQLAQILIGEALNRQSQVVYFAVDFECLCAMRGNNWLPLEIGMEVVNVQEALNVGGNSWSAPSISSFHSFIKSDPCPAEYVVPAAISRRRIHGIPSAGAHLYHADPGTVLACLSSFVSMWLPPGSVPIFLGKACECERSCLGWIERQAGALPRFSARTCELQAVLLLLLERDGAQPSEKTLERRIARAYGERRFGRDFKCHYHADSQSRSSWHCALADARAEASLVIDVLRRGDYA